jgi:hypothetical protein
MSALYDFLYGFIYDDPWFWLIGFIFCFIIVGIQWLLNTFIEWKGPTND